MPKIVISTSSFDIENSPTIVFLRSEGFEIILNPYGRRLSEHEIKGLVQGDVLGMIAGVEPLTRKVFESAPSLKVVSRCGIGLDSVDLGAAKDLGISVSNTPDAPTEAVAELTIAIMLDLLRNVSEADRNIRSSNWKPLMGNLLSCQTIGIIGYGRIGKKVCQILKSFGSKLLVYDQCEVDPEPGIEKVSLEELLSSSDIVSLHVPYEPSTHHLINGDRLRMMKPGAFLLNVSRGGLVDEHELYVALTNGKLAGAGLDAFEQEPYLGPLRELPNVVLNAHMGSYAKECRVQMEREAAENLVQGLIAQGILKCRPCGSTGVKN